MKNVKDTTKQLKDENELIEMNDIKRLRVVTIGIDLHHTSLLGVKVIIPITMNFSFVNRVWTGLMNKTVINGTHKGSLTSMS